MCLRANKQMELKELTFDIQLGDVVHLSDPCYEVDKDTFHCDFNVQNVPCLSGTWKVKVDVMQNEFGSGTIIKGFSAVHVHTNFDYMSLPNVRRFDVGVDSGQFGIFDSSIYENDADYDRVDSFYRACADATLSDARCGVIKDKGFVCSSGYGDGSYLINAYFHENGKLGNFSIQFVEFVDEEWDDTDWDEDEGLEED